jgi:elongation factor P
MIQAVNLKKGNFIKMNQHCYSVLKKEICSPSQDPVSLNFTLFNLDTGETSVSTFSGSDQVEKTDLPFIPMKLIHRSENSLVFSEDETGEQLEITTSMLGDKASFLGENSSMEVFYYNDMVASVELPQVVVFEIDHTEDIEKDSSNLEYIKSARLNNGQIIRVPAFVKTGDKVRIYSETGEYISRE